MRDYRIVGIAQLAICRAPGELACLGLGSCVAIILYDPLLKIGGIVHVLLPKAPPNCDSDEKYADTGTKKLLKELLAKGVTKDRLVAKLVGGAQMFSSLNLSIANIGRQNVEEAKKTLKELKIRLASESTEGNRGRSAYLDTQTGKVTVETAFLPSKTI
jgi:chemotaxis protein CheD